MTRINSAIPVKYLTDEMLLAEHREIKRLPSVLSKAIKCNSISKILNKFCLGTGHVKFFLNKMLFIFNRYKIIKSECQQKLNEVIKNASNNVLIAIIKDGRNIPIHHPYCTYSEIFLLEDLAINELNSRGIDTVNFHLK